MTEQKKAQANPRTPRHLARVFALLGLYQWFADLTQDYASIEAHLSELVADDADETKAVELDERDFKHADQEFFKRLLSGVLDRHVEIAEIVSKAVDRDLKRVSMVERCVLYIGTYELLACPETPWRVVMNESVELAKSFGSGNRYTNGVLEGIAKIVRPAEVQG